MENLVLGIVVLIGCVVFVLWSASIGRAVLEFSGAGKKESFVVCVIVGAFVIVSLLLLAWTVGFVINRIV